MKPTTYRLQIYPYIQLVRLDKPIGIFLLLWPTFWGLWAASASHPSFKLICIFTLGTLLMRSAGCAINDYADRNLDGQVSRTQARPLAQNKITPNSALYVAASLSLLAFSLVLQTNTTTIFLSFGALALTALYPFTKRFTHGPQVFLGLAFAWGIPMAYTAQNQALDLSCWLLFISTICWTIAYDTQYAMVDRQDDLKAGIKSTAIYFGEWDKFMIALLQGLVLLSLSLVALIQAESIIFYFCLFGALMTFVYQQFLIRDRAPAECFKAFLNNNLSGAFIFFGFLLSSLKSF